MKDPCTHIQQRLEEIAAMRLRCRNRLEEIRTLSLRLLNDTPPFRSCLKR